MALHRKLLHDKAEAVGDGEIVPTAGKAGVTIQVSGTFSGTIVPEGTLDGVSWYTIDAYNLQAGTRVVEITGEGLFWMPAPGLYAVRARISSRASGAITVLSGATEIPYGQQAA